MIEPSSITIVLILVLLTIFTGISEQRNGRAIRNLELKNSTLKRELMRMGVLVILDETSVSSISGLRFERTKKSAELRRQQFFASEWNLKMQIQSERHEEGIKGLKDAN